MPRAHPSRPGLENLDDRLVPSTVDLTTAGSSGVIGVADDGVDDAIVRQTDAQPTGTGYIRSFVRVQGAASGGGMEQGYNTDGRPLQYDENKSPQFTRSITLGQVPLVTIDNVQYREFLLDINQKSSSPLLSLDEVRVYQASTGNLTSLSGLTAAWDMDATGDHTVKLNYRLNAGSGAGDMLLLIPNSAFANQDPNSFLYLYSKFGAQSWGTANAGFEEWAVRAAPPASPPPVGTGSISGAVMFDADQDGDYSDSGDHGIAGVVIHLRGLDDLGNTVDLTFTTGADGLYSFTNLRAGTYTIWQEMVPEGYIDGEDYLGMIDGVESEFWGVDDLNDKFRDIQLGVGQHGTNYVFTEWFGPQEQS
jgi:hypothetical protein